MNFAGWLQDPLIQPQKPWMHQSFFGFGHSQLRIGKSDPYFLHFIFSKISVDFMDLGSQEGSIRKIIFYRKFSAGPDPVSLYVNTNKIFMGIQLCEPRGV